MAPDATVFHCHCVLLQKAQVMIFCLGATAYFCFIAKKDMSVQYLTAEIQFSDSAGLFSVSTENKKVSISEHLHDSLL